MIEYRVPLENAAEFLAALHDLSVIRRRDGARRWSVVQDLDDLEIWRERYQTPTWAEHLRRVGRQTLTDRALRHRVEAFHVGEGPPVIRRALERPPGAEAIGLSRID